MTDLLSNYNLYSKRTDVEELLRESANLVSQGLLVLIKASDGSLSETQQKGLLGYLLAARQYRRSNPESLVVSVDDPMARLWLRMSKSRERADLLGVRHDSENDVFAIDVIEVKTHQEGGEPYALALSDKAADQIRSTIDALRRVFMPTDADSPLLAPRLEVLKQLFYEEFERAEHNRQYRQKWNPLLERLLQDRNRPTVRIEGHIYQFVLNREIDNQTKMIRPIGQDPITQHIFGTQRVQKLLESSQEPIGDIPPDSSTPEPASSPTEKPGAPGGVQQAGDADKTAQPSHEVSEVCAQPTNLSPSGPPTPTALPPARRVGDEARRQTAEMAQTRGAEPDATWLRRVAESFVRASANYGVLVTECNPAKTKVGPSVVRFPFTLAKGQPRKKLDQHIDDIAREMSIMNVLIQTTPEAPHLALDVPRPTRVQYNFVRDGLPHLPTVASPEQLPFLLGISPAGEPKIGDLHQLVHILVGGTTGAGKTVFLYDMILSFLARHPSERELELVLCTSKPEDFVFFESLPHLSGRPIISDARDAVMEIQGIASGQLRDRSQLLSRARVQKIEDYNRLPDASSLLHPIIVVVDEFADLSDQVSNDKRTKEAFYTSVRQIAQAGRNRGVHLVLCTQRPTADLLPGTIKALMNARVALKMNSALDSRIILDEDGAERLLGNGDLLFKDPEGLQRLQAYFAGPSEIELVLAQNNIPR